MPALIPDYQYDIFVSYRHKDNKGDQWVTTFVTALKAELEATFKEDVSIYFDHNPADGLLENHHVDKSLEGKLSCLVFIPILSPTYCDPKSFAWKHEFCAFNALAKNDSLGMTVSVARGNVSSRILPVRINELDPEDNRMLESELGSALRSIDFIYREHGVSRPLKISDDRSANLAKTDYTNQINKVGFAIKEIISGLRNPVKIANTRLTAPTAPRPGSYKKVAAVVLGVLVVLAGVVFLLYKRTPSSARLEKSIAVLPFVNMSNDPDQEYFSDGLTEEIIDRLAKIRDLRVISRTSAMEYKKTNKHIPVIAKELGVSYILEGSVRRADNRLRITFQLIKGANDEHIWSETIDRPLTGIFEAQREIAMQLTNYFQITLSEADDGMLNKIPTRFISAYDWYLKGNQLSAQRLDDNNRAIACFKEALKIDPNFSEAMGRLSYYYAKQGVDLNNGKQWLDTAYRYAAKGYALTPESPLSNVTLGFVYFYQQRDSLALIYFKKSNVHTLSSGLRPISNIFLDYGMPDSAFYYAERLRTLEPLAPAYSQIAVIEMALGNWQAARPFVLEGVNLGGTPSSRDIVKYIAIDFHIRMREYAAALKIINDSFANVKDETLQKRVSNYLLRIYYDQKDWAAFSSLLTTSNDDWRALMNKQRHQPEFKNTLSRLEKQDPQNQNLFLLKEEYQAILEGLKKMPPAKRYMSYQRWVENPFADQFIKTQEFKTLFAGYQPWVQTMEANIKKMRN